MSYGGGTWLVQNKVLPGTYINFQSLSRAELIFSDRGYAAIGLELDWGVDGFNPYSPGFSIYLMNMNL